MMLEFFFLSFVFNTICMKVLTFSYLHFEFRITYQQVTQMYFALGPEMF